MKIKGFWPMLTTITFCTKLSKTTFLYVGVPILQHVRVLSEMSDDISAKIQHCRQNQIFWASLILVPT